MWPIVNEDVPLKSKTQMESLMNLSRATPLVSRIDKVIMFIEDPVSSSRASVRHPWSRFTWKVWLWWLDKPAHHYWRKLGWCPRICYLLKASAQRRSNPWLVGYPNNGHGDGQALFGIEVNLIVEVPEFKTGFVHVDPLVCIWLASNVTGWTPAV